MKGLNEAQRIYDRREPGDQHRTPSHDDNLCRETPLRGDPNAVITSTKAVDLDAIERLVQENRTRYAASHPSRVKKP